MSQINDLENIVSANNQSEVFPILANIYYQKKLYKYAVKTCTLGLKGDPDNLEGLYVLAKTLLMQGETEKAEQVLKNIIKISPYHLYSALLLISIFEDLNRNKKILRSHIKKVHDFYPSHPKIKEYYKKYCVSNKKKPRKRNQTVKPRVSSKTFNYNPKLATITMYKLLYSQNKHEDALALLKILAKNPKFKIFADKELKKIELKLYRS